MKNYPNGVLVDAGPVAYKARFKKVIFNNPATIVFWDDDTKTVVKCGDDDVYDPEKGVALCFMKKALGNHGNFNYILKNCVKQFEDEERPMTMEEFTNLLDDIFAPINKLNNIFAPLNHESTEPCQE